MAKAKPSHSFLFLFHLLFFTAILQPSSSQATAAPRTDFIKSSCRSTHYPSLCVQCLSGYAPSIQQDPRQLARAALQVSLARAQSAATYVAQLSRLQGITPRESQAVQDCVQNVGDSVSRLSRSIDELGQMGGGQGAAGEAFDWHMSNVQTWVSGALTDENTCFDGFARPGMDGKAKSAVRGRLVEVAQVVSNALALVDRFGSRHRGAAKGKP
ncbi:21 kDa protein-like [Rhodamnia argentea]|uniref:21 kDa protein-like n=1 Tax=Rhodamnia argentea TaxID=178133 RepID=A0ABM3H5U9_9MYRT|nr:21 kDa protein-like [Rhodamnia argentea]